VKELIKPIFILETHSEHMMLRFLRRIRETSNNELPEGAPPLKSDDVAVYYFSKSAEGVDAQRLRIDDQGEFIDRWPKGFFEERAEELF
jgi:predicted ATPase